MSQTSEARSKVAASQPNESPADIDFETRFKAWDCESRFVRTWALGSPKQVISLVRLIDETADDEEMGFATPMEVTIAPASMYGESTSWREYFSEPYQVAVYPNVNPDWGEIEATVATVEEALGAAEAVCADLEADHDLLEAEATGVKTAALSARGPKPTF